MIELRNVTKEYSKGHAALNGVSVRIERGEFVFIVGDSGSGKSTLIRLIMKELNPTEGTIIVNGQNLNRMKRRNIAKYRRGLGVVFQDFRLLKDRNIYENIAMHDGMAIGFYLSKGKNNLVLNCDAYNNYDNFSEGIKGGNVDGFGGHPASISDTGNVFRGCRAWWNSDDGFDLINASAPITIDRCWSFYNGYQPQTKKPAGDGTGFKAGGYGMGDRPKAPKIIPEHVISNCLACDNRNKGFYANHHLGGILWYNNTGYKNPSNFCMLNRKNIAEKVDVLGYNHVLLGNVSFMPKRIGADIVDIDKSKCIVRDNSFYSDNCILTEEDFESLEESLLMSPRKVDGKLPEITFLRPVKSSWLYSSRLGYTHTVNRIR